MDGWISGLRDASLVEFSVLSVVTVRQWRRSHLHGAGWAAATFTMLAAISIGGRLVPRLDDLLPTEWVVKGLIAVLLLVPYALFRFAATFDRPRPSVRRIAAGLTVFVIAWTAALPSIPAQGAPVGAPFVAYRIAIGIQWVFAFTYVATRLWRAGATGSTPARRRMRLLSAASIGMNVPILIGALGLSGSMRVTLFSQSASVAAAALFVLALAPPAFLRMRWRRPEQAALRAAVAELLGATSAEEVANGILPRAAAIIGADGVVLVETDGTVVASYGNGPVPDADGEWDAESVVRAPLERGEMIFRTSPYAPYFGHDEVDLLEGLGYFMNLALDRCASAAWEREFIANAAHELRTPLTVLSGLATTLASRRHDMADEKVGDCLDAMERQGARACRLVNALLDLAQLDRGTLRLVVETVDIGEAVATAIESTPVPEGCRIATRIPYRTYALGDRGRLDQVLVNLFTNAFRHGGQHVMISARRAGAMVEISVSDDGPGVASEIAGLVFQPFARTIEGNGSGLGLAISQRVIAGLGGTIHHEAIEPHGARFVIRLPRAGVGRAASECRAEAEPAEIPRAAPIR